MGYTPSFVVGVWAGNNDNKAMHKNGSSILAAVPIWHNFMVEALKTQSPQAFTKPDPLPATKQALDGECTDASGTPHTILYCVDPADPTGPAPRDPASDPQYHNWEASVQVWAGTHPVVPPSDTSTSTIPADGNGSSTPGGIPIVTFPPFFPLAPQQQATSSP
jgi:membrane peptidoglycan carboxypeptidase